MNRIGQSRSGVDTPVRVLDGRERLARLRVRLLVRVQPQREMQVAPPHDRCGGAGRDAQAAEKRGQRGVNLRCGLRRDTEAVVSAVLT